MGAAPVVSDMTLQIPKGSSCLLIGPNGAGKTTFLKVLGGKHMVPESAVTVLGQPPFHATSLTADGKLAYLGGNWDRDIAFAGYSVPLQVFQPKINGTLSARHAWCLFMQYILLCDVLVSFTKSLHADYAICLCLSI